MKIASALILALVLIVPTAAQEPWQLKGVDESKLSKTERHTVNGKAVSPVEAKRMLQPSDGIGMGFVLLILAVVAFGVWAMTRQPAVSRVCSSATPGDGSVVLHRPRAMGIRRAEEKAAIAQAMIDTAVDSHLVIAQKLQAVVDLEIAEGKVPTPAILEAIDHLTHGHRPDEVVHDLDLAMKG